MQISGLNIVYNFPMVTLFYSRFIWFTWFDAKKKMSVMIFGRSLILIQQSLSSHIIIILQMERFCIKSEHFVNAQKSWY